MKDLVEELIINQIEEVRSLPNVIQSIKNELVVYIQIENHHIPHCLIYYREHKRHPSEIFLLNNNNELQHMWANNNAKFSRYTAALIGYYNNHNSIPGFHRKPINDSFSLTFNSIVNQSPKISPLEFHSRLYETARGLEENAKQSNVSTEENLISQVKNNSEWDNTELISHFINHQSRTRASLSVVFWMIIEGVESSNEVRLLCDQIIEMISKQDHSNTNIPFHISDLFTVNIHNKNELNKLIPRQHREYIPDFLLSTDISV